MHAKFDLKKLQIFSKKVELKKSEQKNIKTVFKRLNLQEFLFIHFKIMITFWRTTIK